MLIFLPDRFKNSIDVTNDVLYFKKYWKTVLQKNTEGVNWWYNSQ